MASISLANELVILLIFVIMSILLAQSQWERYRMGTKWKSRRCVNRDPEQFSKSNTSCRKKTYLYNLLWVLACFSFLTTSKLGVFAFEIT